MPTGRERDPNKRQRPLAGKYYDPLAADTSKKRGRKMLINEEVIKKITEMVKVGGYVEVACAAAGISQGSYYSWLRVGRGVAEDEERLQGDFNIEDYTEYEVLCHKFLREIVKANAEAEMYAVTIIRKAMGDSWQAAMTYLERRHPGRWKRREEVAVTPFTVQSGVQSGIDEAALLQDPAAVDLLHEALEKVTNRTVGELTEAASKGEDISIVDAEIVDATEGESGV